MLIRTSASHPLLIAEVRPNEEFGYIGITFCPGKYDRFAATGIWERDLAADLSVIKGWNASIVLTLLEMEEIHSLRVTGLEQEIHQQQMDWIHMPIKDFSIPDHQFETRWQQEGKVLRQSLRSGNNILVHCKGGLGRAGMIAARLLVELGMEPKEAIRLVRHKRQGAIETPAQLALVRNTKAILDE